MLMPSPHHEAHDRHLQSYRETGIQKVIGIGREVNGLRKDGTQFPLDLAVSEIVTEGRRTFVGILRDITERRNAEKAVEQSRRQLAEVTAHIPGAVFQMQRVGADGSRFLFVSEGIEILIGKTAREITENPLLMMEHIHPDDAFMAANKVRDALQSGSAFEYKYSVQRDGVVRWLAASAGPQVQGSGDLLWNGIITDVTTSKAFEQELAMYAEELTIAAAAAEASTKAKSEFLATMSHEIRTPMNGVIGMTGLLLETPLSAEQKDFAETIRTSGEALLGIINDILDFSKIEAGKLDLEYSAFDLRPVVEESLEVVAPLAQRKRLELCAPMEDAVPAGLVGDPARLRQILLNLLSNAIKFTEAGEIVLSVAREKTEDQERAWLRFEIRDTGIGISPETQARLFQSFSQADSSTTRLYGGTGLGLAICKRLIELMGGEIGIRSAPGLGSTFWFTIPFTTTTEIISVPAAVENLKGRRVLGVDDNGTNRSILKQQLGNVGMVVTCVARGAEALAELTTAARLDRPYELAILDLHMPVMNGLMLAREIRDEKAISSIPLMMLTSDRDRDEVNTARELDVKIFLVKPVRQAHLIRAVGEMFGAMPAASGEDTLVKRTTLGGRVLVVEDNPTNRKVIGLRLEKLGCTVLVAHNGQEAVEAVGATAYDAILMDCQMPVMDGFEATREIRRRGGPYIPIIALTANAMDGERERCLAAGMDDYWSKPVRAEELVKKLQHWMGFSERRGGAASETERQQAAGVKEALDQFAASMGDEGIEREDVDLLFNSFLQTSGPLMEELRQAISERDGGLSASLAHTLKGSFATFGLQALANFAAELEQKSKGQTWDGTEETMTLARSAYQEARELVTAAIRIPVE